MKHRIILSLMSLVFVGAAAAPPLITIDNHEPKYSPEGVLQPWTSFGDTLDREMAYYLRIRWSTAIPPSW